MIRNNRVEELRAEDPSAARVKFFYVVCVQRMRFRYNFYEKKSSAIAAIIATIWKPLSSDRNDRSDNNR